MPMTITTGWSQKSVPPTTAASGATCSVEFEAEHGLLENDLDAFRRKVQSAFVACRQAVQDELSRQQARR